MNHEQDHEVEAGYSGSYSTSTGTYVAGNLLARSVSHAN